MGLIQDFLARRPNSPIFHYAGAAAAISIVKNRKIWASKIDHLNDAAEHTHAAKQIADELQRRDRRSGTLTEALKSLDLYRADPPINPTYSMMLTESEPAFDTTRPGRSWLSFAQKRKLVYVASFSEEGDSLSQWRAYCSDGNGYSLGFDASGFEGAPRSGLSLVRCVYENDEKNELVTALIDDCEARDDGSDGSVWPLFLDILVIMASMKHVSFKDEREWRLVCFEGSLTPSYRSGRHGIVPYLEVPFGGKGELQLSNVWIGPNSDPEAALESARKLVKAHEDEDRNVNFRVSDTPYRQ